MTAALSWPLQAALFQRLSADPTLLGILGPGRIFDAPPHADGPDATRPPYVLLGDESVGRWSDKSATGAVHDLVLRIISGGEGYAEAKQIAAAVSDALADAGLDLSRGRVVRLTFRSASARRNLDGVRRQIDLRYRAVLEDA